jgi:hypothetical protein
MAQDGGLAPNLATRQIRPTSGNELMADAAKRNDMHPEEIMKPDLLSEIVLTTFGTLSFLVLMALGCVCSTLTA